MKTQLLFKFFLVFVLSLLITCKSQGVKKKAFGGSWKDGNQTTALAKNTDSAHVNTEEPYKVDHSVAPEISNSGNNGYNTSPNPKNNVWHSQDYTTQKLKPPYPTKDSIKTNNQLPIEKNAQTAGILSLISIITIIGAFFLFPFILGFGIASLRKIKKNPGKYRGKELVVASIVLSVLSVGALILLIILISALGGGGYFFK